ncbi:hypothetical protein ACFWP5_07165 [Streptomyces sp. NPDC058469]|uniref:hypothetical protein n=1 Tax=Streptomyces sp. NPDC058469 TaxID=3346514 RepID=UPI003658E9A8
MARFMYDVTGEAVAEPDAETVRRVPHGIGLADVLRLFGPLATGGIPAIRRLPWNPL